MENHVKTTNNSSEVIKLLEMSSSETENESPSFSHFKMTKPKRKVRFKKNFRPSSKLKPGCQSKNANCNCHIIEGAKVLVCLMLVVLIATLLWYVVNLSTRIQELQKQFSDNHIKKHDTFVFT